MDPSPATFATPRDHEEYAALRATIRERGTARVYVFALGMTGWSALTLVALLLPPVAALAPLVALGATFEAVLALHVGVERIGRYLLVRHGDAWEQAAGQFGRPSGAIATDPLFTLTFVIAALLSLLPLLTTPPIVQELAVVVAGSVIVIVRVVTARIGAQRQRAVDEARFRDIAAKTN